MYKYDVTTPVPTPEPTPKGSPQVSPPPERNIVRPQTPVITPDQSQAEGLVEEWPVSMATDTEESELQITPVKDGSYNIFIKKHNFLKFNKKNSLKKYLLMYIVNNYFKNIIVKV